MECWPFSEDSSVPLKRRVHHCGVQAGLESNDQSIQTTGDEFYPQSTQYYPQQLSGLDESTLFNSSEVLSFLEEMESPWRDELICSGVVDMLQDDFGFQITDQELTSSEQKETVLRELHTLTDIQFSKSRQLTHLEWSPHKQGVLAVVSLDVASFETRSGDSGRPKEYALVEWDVSNPMKPERFLHAHHELTAFNYHPILDSIIAAGTYTGQVVLWDQRESDGGDYPSYCSAVECSHNQPIIELKWTPGSEVNRSGHLTLLEPGLDCHTFVTLSTDGKLLFWDTRIEKLSKKGKIVDANLKMHLRPLLTIPFFADEGGDLILQRMCFPITQSNPKLKLGTTDGVLVLADLSKAQGNVSFTCLTYQRTTYQCTTWYDFVAYSYYSIYYVFCD
eukprot:g9268.t1